MATILSVADEPFIGTQLGPLIEQAGHHALTTRSVHEALTLVTRERVDLILADYQIPGRTGLDLLQVLKTEGHDIPLIMLTGYASIEQAVTAVQAGAVSYLPKPVDFQRLEIAIDYALAVTQLRRENASLRDELQQLRQSRTTVSPDGALRLDTLNIAAAEQRLIDAALARTNGNRTKAAALLGLSLRTLRSRLNSPDA
jgi:DNA-binding NtrC family response regulator